MARCSLLTEGGRWGPVIVCAGFVTSTLISAMARCTGVLFLSFQNEFQSSTAQTGAISSIITSMSFFGCAIAGVLCNRFGCRFTAIFGGILYTGGLIVCSLTSNIYQMYIGSFVTGLGNGLTVAPWVVAVALYFRKNQTMATGFVYLGNAVGLISFAPMMQSLLDAYGWRGTLLVCGAIFGNTCVTGALLRPVRFCKMAANNVTIKGEDDSMLASEDIGVKTHQNVAPVKIRRLAWLFRFFNNKVVKPLELGLLRQSYRFSVFCFSRIIADVTYGCFLVYVIVCAVEAGVPQQRASFLISIVGISCIPGYLLCGLVNKAVSSLVIMLCTLLAYVGGVLISLLALHFRSYSIFVLSGIVIGAAAGFKYSVGPTIICEYVGKDKFASAFGIYNGFAAVADLLSPIIAGALYDVTESFFVMFAVLASVSFAGFAVMLTTPYLKRIEPGVFTASVDV